MHYPRGNCAIHQWEGFPVEVGSSPPFLHCSACCLNFIQALKMGRYHGYFSHQSSREGSLMSPYDGCYIVRIAKHSSQKQMATKSEN